MGNLDVTTPLQGHPTWIRGTRGWGSAQPTSDANLTDFQQHYVPPLPVNYTEALDVIRRETAADMFLNWVYRRTDTLGSTFSVAPGTWQGFLNMSWHPQDLRWSNCTAGCTDYSYPGDARYLWMQDVINQFDALYGW